MADETTFVVVTYASSAESLKLDMGSPEIVVGLKTGERRLKQTRTLIQVREVLWMAPSQRD